MSALLTIISADRSGWKPDLHEFWHYRELLGFLAWRDIRVRYRQTFLGFAWALLEPFASVVVFTLLFHRAAGLDSGDIPYPLYCYAGMLLWTFFGRALTATTMSFVSNAALLRKVYFPRLVLPVACLIATTVDFLCALLMYAVLLIWYQTAPTWHIFTLPLWIALAAICVLGVGLGLAAVNVRYRDISQTVPFLVQMWLFATPVAYPLSTIPTQWQPIYALNPMVGAVEGMRWALLPEHPLNPLFVLTSAVVGSLFLAIGFTLFQRAQRAFADVI